MLFHWSSTEPASSQCLSTASYENNVTLIVSEFVFTQLTRDVDSNAGIMLGQRRRRWADIKPALVQHLVFAGYNIARKGT